MGSVNLENHEKGKRGMAMNRRICLLVIGLLISCGLAGCAAESGGQAASPQQAAKLAQGPVPFVRANHLCASLGQGKADVAAIKADLVKVLSEVDGGATANVVYDPAGNFYEFAEVVGASDAGFTVKHLRLEYAELMDRRVIHKSYDNRCDSIEIEGLMSFSFCNRDHAWCLTQEFYAIQKDIRKQYVEGSLASFQPHLDEYRAMKTKPPVTEEQRRHIVQANAMAEKKDYSAAIDLYRKALNVDRLSYPAAYYNMALIFSQMGRRQAAIVFMKVYLLLVPEAEDARRAQDKIYEWEAFSGVQ